MSSTLTMTARSLRLSARSPEALLTALMLPVMLMVMFVYLFSGAVAIGTSYVTYVVPGVLLLCAVTGAATTAVTVCQDMTSGIIDRFRSLDVPGPAVLAGHVAASLVRNVISTALVTAVAVGIGFRPHASVAAFAAAVGVLLLFVAAVSWLAAAFGLLVSAPEAANSAMFFLMFFSYASSAFVPVRTMPSWLRGFAGHQPATPVTETIRGLLLGQPAGSHLGTALAWCLGILAASVVGSELLFRRRTAELSAATRPNDRPRQALWNPRSNPGLPGSPLPRPVMTVSGAEVGPRRVDCLGCGDEELSRLARVRGPGSRQADPPGRPLRQSGRAVRAGGGRGPAFAALHLTDPRSRSRGSCWLTPERGQCEEPAARSARTYDVGPSQRGVSGSGNSARQ